MFSRVSHQRKSPKVADETMFPIPGQDMAVYAHDINRGEGTRQQRCKGLLVISTIARVSLSLLSCFFHHHAHGTDGVWVTGEMGRTAEIDHLMVSDSMRYAILM